MADDPYKTLGVPRDATEPQIRKAYLKLAKTTHPDLNPGDAKAEERFKAVNAAHDLLQDTGQRARYDRGEIDGAGQPRPPPGPPPGSRRYRDHAEGAAGARYSAGMDDDLGDILSGMFGARGRAGFGAGPAGGADRRYTLQVSFLDAARGATQRLSLPDGGSLDVRIPAGVDSGQVLRLRGKGAPGTPPGDALIEIEVGPHPLFRREGRDIHLDLPVTVAEAVLGGRVTVPTVDGPVSMAVPPGSSTGTRLRLRGRGVAASGGQPAGRRLCHVARRARTGRSRTGRVPADPHGRAGLEPARRAGRAAMMTWEAVLVILPGLDRAEVEAWVAQDLLRPAGDGGAWLFHDMDVARLQPDPGAAPRPATGGRRAARRAAPDGPAVRRPPPPAPPARRPAARRGAGRARRGAAGAAGRVGRWTSARLVRMDEPIARWLSLLRACHHPGKAARRDHALDPYRPDTVRAIGV